MPAGRPESGGDQQSAEFVAVQAGGVRLIVQPGTADVGGRGVLQELRLDGVLIEPGDRAQPAGDRGPGPAAGFQVPREALDVRAAGLCRPCRLHQLANWRRSSSYAWRVRPE
jgi:hypothetical protein